MAITYHSGERIQGIDDITTNNPATESAYSYTAGSENSSSVHSGYKYGQKLDSGHSGIGKAIHKVEIRVKKVGSPTGNAQFEVIDPDGSTVVGTGDVDISTFGTSYALVEVTLDNYVTLEANSRVVLHYSGGDSSNYGMVGVGNVGGAGANTSSTSYNGSSWVSPTTRDSHLIFDSTPASASTTTTTEMPTNVPDYTRFEATDTRKIFTKLPYFTATTGLKAYWKFNETSGDIINQQTTGDGLGSEADIAITGATYSQTGQIGNSLLFDGVNDYGVSGSSVSQFNFMHNTSALFSMNFWYKKGATLSTDARIYNDFTDSSSIGFGLSFGISDLTKLVFILSAGGGNLTETSSATSFLPADTNFHMITVTYNQSLGSNNLIMYIDGGSAETFNKPAHALSDSNSSFTGNFCRRPDGVAFAEMSFDECSIWSKVLTTTEITELYNSGNGKSISSTPWKEKGTT